MKLNRYAILGLLTVGLCLPAGAQSAVRIESVEGMDTRIPIAVPPFAGAQPDLADVAAVMAQVITFDLDFTGLFVLFSPERYPGSFRGFGPEASMIDWDAWRSTKAEYLIYGFVRQEGTQYIAQFRLFDLAAQEQVVGQELRVEQSFPRLAAHRFSEEVIRYLEGIPGIGTSRIAFSAGQTGNKEIYVADYDGANASPVTRHNSISIKPKFSPDGNQVAYLSYKDRYAFLYILDLRSGKSVALSKEVGLNSSPAWSPDSKRIAMTLSKDGNTEIYLRDPDGRNPLRLTRNPYGDTQPTFSPDGRQIAFVSDRLGSAQIYVMDADGENQRRISHQGGSACDPAWSLDGQYIAYVVLKSGDGFEIYAMNADGTDPRRLTDSHGSNESPTWSADSRHIAFMSTRSGRSELWAVTFETLEEKRLSKINLSCEGPAWGPRRR